MSTNTMFTDRWFEDNQSNWDDRAAVHEASGYGIAALVDDPTAISPELALDLPRFGDLSGRDVIHLQCHLGTDTVGFARRGARRVVGVDLSEESVRRARLIAQRCQANVEYIQSNVYDAREAVSGHFDLVYTSLGVLCWLPDVTQWARVVASLMNEGATFFIRDDHPMFMTIADDISDGLKVEGPYFQLDDPTTWDEADSYVGHVDDAPAMTHTVSHQWNHSLGEIITALIQAGLVIDRVEEDAASWWCPWSEDMAQGEDGRWRLKKMPERLPLQFVIEAHKQ